MKKTNKQAVRYKTQWATQFYTAAELTRRGYFVSLTFGNAPVSDLLVQSPQGTQFTVDVKGQSTRNFWLIQSRPVNPSHYFILVYLPQNLEPPKYFVLSSDELMRRREEYRQSVLHRGKYRDELGGINWSTAFDYENQWENLPD
ncbi:MAG: hypothetical protein ACFFCW_22945 [Candidatus Hodarchaeota archaeon]